MSGGLSHLGEFGLIQKIISRLKIRDPNVLLGPGDDCAVVRPAKTPILLSTDMLVEGVHFRRPEPGWRQGIGWKDLGLKAIRVNISDIAAMGGTPLYFLVALGLPRNFKMAAIDRLMSGMKKGAEEVDASIVGGNLSRSRQLIISVAVFGVASKKRFLRRSGARVGDFIYVTGTLGKSALALAAGWHLVPPLRLKVGQRLARMDSVHSLIDISDGLAGDLGHILERSGVGAEVYVKKIPMPKGAGLGGGEDYELLFTASPRVKLPRKIHGVPVTRIGKITRKGTGLTFLDTAGCPIKRSAEIRAFRHF